MSRQKSPPLKIVRIQVYQSSDDPEKLRNKINQTIKQRFPNATEKEGLVEVLQGKALCQFKCGKSKDLLVLSSTITYDRDYDLKSLLSNDLKLFDISDMKLQAISDEPLSTFQVLSPLTGNLDTAVSQLRRISDQLSMRCKGIGIVGGCLLSILEPGTQEEETFDRTIFLSPTNRATRDTEERLRDIETCIRDIATKTAELSKIYMQCKNFFSVLDSGEKEIGEKIEGFLWKLIAPEPVNLETLESWLGYVMERQSTTSAMNSTMQVNQTEATTITNEVQHIYTRLNETSFEDYPRNTEIEKAAYQRIIQPFEDYVVRSQALKTRLETAMEEIRTYLSLQQQKITMAEQTSSREQLVRLVNLQEILHKLEILIVAFYLTEMASLIFEALAHETAGTLTVAFIPFSLLISTLLSRLLHRQRTEHS